MRLPLTSTLFPAHVWAMLALYFIASLAHYTLALCSEHTFMMNLTIWGEAVSGLVLALCCVVFATRLMTSKAPRAQ